MQLSLLAVSFDNEDYKMGFLNGLIKWLKGVLSPIWLLKENIRSLIAFEFVFRLLTFLVIFPIMTWTQDQSDRVVQRAAISDESDHVDRSALYDPAAGRYCHV
jgi:hypothetical protein